MVQPVRCVQRDVVAGAFDLLVAPSSLDKAVRHLHALAVKVVVVCDDPYGRVIDWQNRGLPAFAATALFRWLVPSLPSEAKEVVFPHTKAAANDD